MDQILPLLIAVLGANLLTVMFVYGVMMLAKNGHEPRSTLIACAAIPLIAVVLGVLAYL